MAQEMKIMHEDVLASLPDYIGAQPFEESDRGQDQIIRLAEFIRRRFPSISPELLERIFEDAAAGILRDGTGAAVPVTTYGKKIGIELLGRVLGAWITGESRKVQIAVPKEEIKAKSPQAHYVELWEYVDEHAELPPLRFWKMIHAYLVSTGELPELRAAAPEVKRKGRAAQALGEALKSMELSDRRYISAISDHFQRLGKIRAQNRENEINNHES